MSGIKFEVESSTDFREIFENQSEEEFRWMIKQMLQQLKDSSELVRALQHMLETERKDQLRNVDYAEVDLTN